MKKFLKEFQSFAMKGNVMDMAIGVVVGGAFSKIVSSLVSDIIMPAFSLITGRISLSDLKLTMPVLNGDPIVLPYGMFLQNVLDFLLIAMSIFLVIKLLNRLRRKKEEAPPPAPPKPSNEELLLTEIRDLLKDQNSK